MYNPSLHTATNKSIGLTGKPADARTYYYDSVNFVYRPYVSIDEVLGYLSTDASRTGQFSVIINTGGTLTNGVITGGSNKEYWFKDGVQDDSIEAKPAKQTITKDQSDLIDAGGGNYYLPYLDEDGDVIPEDIMPVFVRSNSVQITTILDESTTPPRLYGFPNNATQTIKISIS